MSDTPRVDAMLVEQEKRSAIWFPARYDELLALARQLERKLDLTIEVYNRALDDKAKLERDLKHAKETIRAMLDAKPGAVIQAKAIIVKDRIS